MKQLFIGLCFLSIWACTYEIKVRDGVTAYKLKQYDTALKYLPKTYEKAKSRAEKSKIAWMIAEASRQNGRDEEALLWYERAKNDQYGPDAFREYAYTLKRLERYKEAEVAFKELGIEIGSSYEYRREITATQQADAWKKATKLSGYQVQKVDFNSPKNDYAPSVAPNGDVAFSTDRFQDDKKKYSWTGNGFSDLVLVTKKGEITRFAAPINTDYNEGTAEISADGSEMLFTRCSGDRYAPARCRIWLSTKLEDGTWGTPELLPNQTGEFNYGQPALSDNGATLILSVNDPTGYGEHDLAIMDRTRNGWSELRLLPRSINTPGNDMFPSWNHDTLFYANDYLPGMGGLDIFKTWRLSDGSWVTPQNLKAPINSGGDDFSYAIDRTAWKKDSVIEMGYITSNRANGSGGDDIYLFEKRPPTVLATPPDTTQNSTTPSKSIVYKWLLNVYIVENIYADPSDPNSRILGKKPLIGAKLKAQGMTYTVGANGTIELVIEPDKTYPLTASMDGYLNKATNFNSTGIGKDPTRPTQTYELEIVLDKVFKDREIVLQNIYYDYNQSQIRADAEPSLNALVEVLRQNPNINIQLGSHTDCRGNDSYNQKLSQQRAESAIRYLIEKGVDANRLSAKGYGESNPSQTCDCTKCTEDEHQANRRTTFRIIE